jgi:AraC family transcriptional regulator, regulatory protein of adaptative response / methylated-DNA-[protein]-cysteine methyltransferase
MTASPNPTPRTLATEQDPRWKRILARDKGADGTFWYSVATTGVYCRPSCPSRTARPENVAIHDTLAKAKATGFRACLRCDPDGVSQETHNAALVAQVCALIERNDQTPPLAELAASVGLSAGHFHRLFKGATGLTPKEYAAAHKARRVRVGLSQGQPVSETIYDAGFNSSGRFYANSTGMLGMTPSQYRNGGNRETLRFAVGQCSLGAILVASSAKGVAAILLGDDPDALVQDLQHTFPKAALIGADSGYEKLVARVVGLVDTPGLGHDLPLDVRGTAFQRRVWKALQAIPAGTTATYGQIAHAIGAPNATRAVARACAANTLAVAIPCHRVIRRDGAASGYRWGVERKRTLLDRESAHPADHEPSHSHDQDTRPARTMEAQS